MASLLYMQSKVDEDRLGCLPLSLTDLSLTDRRVRRNNNVDDSIVMAASSFGFPPSAPGFIVEFHHRLVIR